MHTEMNIITTTIGILSFAHGVFWGAMRFIRPETFNKGYYLAQILGIRNMRTYIACFVLLPLVVGAVLLTTGMGGVTLSDVVQ